MRRTLATVAAFLALAACSADAVGGITIHPNARILKLGDSTMAINVADENNTNWVDCTGGLIDQINAKIGTTQVGPRRMGPGLGAFPKVGGVQAIIPGGAPIVQTRAVAGWTTNQLSADVGTVTSSFSCPNLYIIGIGINDAVANAVAPATTKTNMDTEYNALQAACPNAQILTVGANLWGEQWTAVGPALNNTWDSNITATNAQIALSCSNHNTGAGCVYTDARADELAYEVANNTPAPGVQGGFLMEPSGAPSQFIHPTYPGYPGLLGPTSGMVTIATSVMKSITVVVP